MPGSENSIEKGGHNRVKKLTRHNWMPTDKPEPERQLKSRKQGWPGGKNSTEKGGQNRVKKLDRLLLMPTDQPNSIAGALRLLRLGRLVCCRMHLPPEE